MTLERKKCKCCSIYAEWLRSKVLFRFDVRSGLKVAWVWLSIWCLAVSLVLLLELAKRSCCSCSGVDFESSNRLEVSFQLLPEYKEEGFGYLKTNLSYLGGEEGYMLPSYTQSGLSLSEVCCSDSSLDSIFVLGSVFHDIVNRNDAVDSMGSTDGSGSVSERALSAAGATVISIANPFDVAKV
ncbi:hypothetical protein Droror1_Dr00006133 [Drosera rotundifolia]